MADHGKKIPDDAKPDEGKKEESKIDIKAAALGALAKFWELHLEDLGKDLPGVDQAIKYLRLIGIDSPSKIATLDGVAKFILRESPLLSPQMKDFIEDVTDPFLDRARQLRGPMAPKSMVDKAIADGRHDAEIRAAVWKVVLKKKMTYAQLEKKLHKEAGAIYAQFMGWVTLMGRLMPKSHARWLSRRDSIEDIERIKMLMERMATADQYPVLDPKDQPEDASSLPDDFHAQWATTQARLAYLEDLFPLSVTDMVKAVLRGEEPPQFTLFKQRLAANEQRALSSARVHERAAARYKKLYGY